jgi:hypothetical protein
MTGIRDPASNGRSSLARAAVAVIALSVVAWLGVIERDNRLYDRGLAAGGRLDAPKTIARAESDLREARLLNPDRTPDILRAVVLRTVRRPAAARALLNEVVRAEPDNLSAWTALKLVGGDGAQERSVAAAMKRLDPRDARVAAQGRARSG